MELHGLNNWDYDSEIKVLSKFKVRGIIAEQTLFKCKQNTVNKIRKK